MARKAFYSFHYDADNWRASQVRNMGILEGNNTVSDNDWEDVKRGGERAIQNWIDGQLHGRSCTVVLIGANTAGRKWIKYEIEKSWKEGKGLVGIHIHKLKDRTGRESAKGVNPFAAYNIDGTPLTQIVKTYDPQFFDSKQVYQHIADNLEKWVEEAIAIRSRY